MTDADIGDDRVYYWSTFVKARAWASENEWPTSFIRCFGRGWAVQACDMGSYAGPDNLVWPGPDWRKEV